MTYNGERISRISIIFYSKKGKLDEASEQLFGWMCNDWFVSYEYNGEIYEDGTVYDYHSLEYFVRLADVITTTSNKWKQTSFSYPEKLETLIINLMKDMSHLMINEEIFLRCTFSAGLEQFHMEGDEWWNEVIVEDFDKLKPGGGPVRETKTNGYDQLWNDGSILLANLLKSYTDYSLTPWFFTGGE